MKPNKKTLLALLCSSFVVSLHAGAADVTYGPAKKKPVPGVEKKIVALPGNQTVSKQNSGGTVYVNNGKAIPDVVSSEHVDGMANNVPLDVALAELVPATFHVSFSGFDPKELMVSWRGGRPWHEIVREIELDNGLDVDIRVDPNRILVARFGASVVSDDPNFDTLPSIDGCKTAHSSSSISPLVSATRVYTYQKGMTLRQTIDEWASADCWAVSYEIPHEFVMPTDNRLYGTFEEVSKQLLARYATAEPPLQFGYWTQSRTLTIQTKTRQNDF